MPPIRGLDPRPFRRPISRPTPLTLATLLAIALLAGSSFAATIVVAPPCTLADAISAANIDVSIGDCTAGSGADTIVLTHDVVLTAALPTINAETTIEGAGFTVSRDPMATSNFTIFRNQASFSEPVEYRNLNITGGNGSDAGGIHSRSEMILVDSTVSGNDGDGIYSSSNTLIERSTVSNNSGSGIYTSYADMTILESTISGNAATGVVVGEYTNVALTNSTISGNDTGIAEAFFVFYPYVDMFNSTIAGNRIGFDVSPQWAYSVYVARSIFGHNLESNCGSAYFISGPGNLADDLSCRMSDGRPFERLRGLSRNLVNHGGSTEIHGLRRDSSAINAAGDCGLETDQRGYLRQPDHCDSGAYEYRSRPADPAVDD